MLIEFITLEECVGLETMLIEFITLEECVGLKQC